LISGSIAGDETTNRWEDVWYSKLEGSPGLVQIKEERGQELLELVHGSVHTEKTDDQLLDPQRMMKRKGK
jgi:hypothetical protein